MFLTRPPEKNPFNAHAHLYRYRSVITQGSHTVFFRSLTEAFLK